jgi:hypothetical protein
MSNRRRRRDYCKGYPRVKRILRTQACTHDTKTRLRLFSDLALQWRKHAAEDTQQTDGCEHRVPACIAHARVTHSRSDCAGDSSVILSSWQNCQRFASVSPFGIKIDVISLFNIYIYTYIYIYIRLLYLYVKLVA